MDKFVMRTATRVLAEGVLRGDRRSLAKAITLVESSNAAHRREAQLLLQHVTSANSSSHRNR